MPQPLNFVPASFTAAEGADLRLTGLSITGVSPTSDLVFVTLTVTSGTLTVAVPYGSGLKVQGNGTNTLIISGGGGIGINNLLSGLSAPVFHPAADFLGSVTLTMHTGDRSGYGDPGGDTDISTITVNGVPVISSNGGGGTASISVAEDTIALTTVIAADPDADAITYSIAGGADAAKFTISDSGVLRFAAAPDFEHPSDSGGNNIYDVLIRASDGRHYDQQAISVTVADVANLGTRFVATSAREIFTGNSEADIFDFDSLSTSKRHAVDIIQNFDGPGGDVIDLFDIDAKKGAGNQAFKFIGTRAFTEHKGELHYKLVGSHGFTLVEGDINGDGKADFQIELSGLIKLTGGDFVL